MSSQPQKDDALFEALGKSKKQKKRRVLRTVLTVILVLAIVLAVGISALRRSVRERFAAMDAEVEAYQVTAGTISTLVSGSGTLTNVDTEVLTVPEGVEVTEILVGLGDSVTQGSLLATVDAAAVGAALSDTQSQLQELDTQIAAAEGDSVAGVISSGVSGRLKAIYAAEGDSVADVMVEHGALAVLSLDGHMALTLETDALREGSRVTVLRADGTELEGTVESAVAGKATILVTDNGPLPEEAVTVLASDGTALGSAVLSIHSPLAVTGYAGTVSAVALKENAQVWAGTQLFYLRDTSHSANYDSLLRSRSELEETLLELLKLQKYGGITAPISGSVFSVADLDSGEDFTDVVVLSPDVNMSVTISVDESDILALELQQEAEVTVPSVSEDVFAGIVTEIDKTAADGAYTAVITLDKTEGMLQGMTANVDVKIQGVDNALIIPVDALHQTSTGAYVYTAYNEQTQEYGGRVEVTTGLSNDDFVEITSGLSAGDTVYYTESQSLFDMFGAMGGMGGGRGGQPGGNNSGFGGGGQMPAMPQDGRGGGQMPGGQMPGWG